MGAKRNTYRVLLQPLAGAEPGANLQAVEFVHRNHDDIARIVGYAQSSSGLAADSAVTMAVGLKLLAQAMLDNKENPLFDGLRQPLREFIAGLKARHAAHRSAA